MSSFTDSDLDLIRRAVAKYRAARGDQGLPTTCMEINGWHDPAIGGSVDKPLNLKTLQRFVSGRRILDKSVNLIREFMDAMEPIDNFEQVGDAAAGLFSTLFATVTGGGALGEKLADRLAAHYDVFLEGQALTRNPEPGADQDDSTFWVPKYPDREYVWDRAFEIIYSRISFISEPYADWLRVVEQVRNPEMDAGDESWVGAETYKGVLTAAGIDSQYAIFLKRDGLDYAKMYMVEPDQNSWGEPVDKQRFIGGLIADVGQAYLTTIGARRVMLVPSSNERQPFTQP